MKLKCVDLKFNLSAYATQARASDTKLKEKECYGMSTKTILLADNEVLSPRVGGNTSAGYSSTDLQEKKTYRGVFFGLTEAERRHVDMYCQLSPRGGSNALNLFFLSS